MKTQFFFLIFKTTISEEGEKYIFFFITFLYQYEGWNLDSRLFENKILFRIDKGDELLTSLKQISKKHKVQLGTITGIGATDDATIGVFDMGEQTYHRIEINTFHEITNITGTLSTMNGESYLHLHITLGNPAVVGGHLIRAVICATCEGVIDIINGRVDRKRDEKTGLNILQLQD